MRQDKTNQMMGQTIQRVAAATSDSLDERPQYQIQELLGKQPGRRTFLAVASDTQSLVVVKLLLFGPDFTWEDLKLFEREAETLKSLDCLAIPKYLDSFEAQTVLGEGFVLVQTYMEAKSLQALAEAGRRFSEGDLKELADALLEILHYLHSRFPAVIHRDIKPSNILLSDRTAHSVGQVYLVDFGSVQTASQGGTMTVVGTYGYMPPEQFGGRAVPASDLYSLGMTLTYLAVGVNPADALDPSADRSLSRRAGFTAAFDQWIAGLSVADLSQRTATAAEALQQLESLSGNLSGAIASSTPSKSALHSANVSSQPVSSVFPLSPVCNDFAVSSTPYEMDIQFPSSRVKGNLRRNKEKSEPLPFFLFISFVCVLFAFSSGSIGWIFWAGVTLYIAYPRSKKVSETKFIQPAGLKLWYPSNGPILLNLESVVSNPNLALDKSFYKARYYKGLSHLALIAIKAEFQYSEAGARLDFFFDDGSGNGRLCIRGKKQEILWICEHLRQWRDISIEGYSAEDTRSENTNLRWS